MTTPENKEECTVKHCLESDCQAKGPYPTLLKEIESAYDHGGPAALAKLLAAEMANKDNGIDRLGNALYLCMFRSGAFEHFAYASNMNTVILLAITDDQKDLYQTVKRYAMEIYHEAVKGTMTRQVMTMSTALDATTSLPEGVTTLDQLEDHYRAYTAMMEKQGPMVQPIFMSSLPPEVQAGLREVMGGDTLAKAPAAKKNLH